MPHTPRHPSLRDLLLASDFGRAHPRRVDELLDRCADPLLNDNAPARHSDDLPLPERIA